MSEFVSFNVLDADYLEKKQKQTDKSIEKLVLNNP
jgi:hypothetical protein